MNIDIGSFSKVLLKTALKGAEINEDRKKTNRLKRNFSAILQEKSENMNEKQKKEYNTKLME